MNESCWGGGHLGGELVLRRASSSFSCIATAFHHHRCCCCCCCCCHRHCFAFTEDSTALEHGTNGETNQTVSCPPAARAMKYILGKPHVARSNQPVAAGNNYVQSATHLQPSCAKQTWLHPARSNHARHHHQKLPAAGRQVESPSYSSTQRGACTGSSGTTSWGLKSPTRRKGHIRRPTNGSRRNPAPGIHSFVLRYERGGNPPPFSSRH